MPDYRALYDVEPTMHDVASVIETCNEPSDAAYRALRRDMTTPRYDVAHINETKDVRFGGFWAGPVHPQHDTVLVLSVPRRRWFRQERVPVVGLEYAVYGREHHCMIDVAYVQTVSYTKRRVYRHASRKLSVRPHEFLVAQFLARIAPILHRWPHTAVAFNVGCFERSESNRSADMYHGLRDRFLTKTLELNPKKERVRQVLGASNAWIAQRV